MAQAYGARARMALAFESVYGTPPGAGWRRMPFVRSGLGGERGLVADDLLGHGRDPRDPIPDAEVVEGEIEIPMDAEALGAWLKALFGAPITTGTGPYVHEFRSGGWDLPSFAVEIGMPDVPHHALSAGCKAESTSWTMARSGQLTATVSVFGRAETIAAVSRSSRSRRTPPTPRPPSPSPRPSPAASSSTGRAWATRTARRSPSRPRRWTRSSTSGPPSRRSRRKWSPRPSCWTRKKTPPSPRRMALRRGRPLLRRVPAALRGLPRSPEPTADRRGLGGLGSRRAARRPGPRHPARGSGPGHGRRARPRGGAGRGSPGDRGTAADHRGGDGPRGERSHRARGRRVRTASAAHGPLPAQRRDAGIAQEGVPVEVQCGPRLLAARVDAGGGELQPPALPPPRLPVDERRTGE